MYPASISSSAGAVDDGAGKEAGVYRFATDTRPRWRRDLAVVVGQRYIWGVGEFDALLPGVSDRLLVPDHDEGEDTFSRVPLVGGEAAIHELDEPELVLLRALLGRARPRLL